MMISFKNHLINPDHITHCELRPADSDDGGDEGDELYIFFLGDGELSVVGDEALALWLHLNKTNVYDSVTFGEPPDRPWLEEQIEELGQHISETGLTA